MKHIKIVIPELNSGQALNLFQDLLYAILCFYIYLKAKYNRRQILKQVQDDNFSILK